MTSGNGLLEGKVAIVSGVGPGLGREIALAFARGANVALGARTQSTLDEVAGAIRAAGGHALAVSTDITKADQCTRIAQRTIEEWGRIDCLVNSAFRPDVFQSFVDVDLNAWRKIFEVNLWGSLQLTKAVIPRMISQGTGSIVFVNSMIVRKILPQQGGYAASKGALLTAAQVLAKELGPHGIRVNSVVPGWMMGPSVELYLDFMAKNNGTSRNTEYARIAADIPLGSIPTDDDCANAVVFFASDLAAVITGQALDVNGGEVFH